MASIFHQRYTVKDASGKTIRKQSQYWYIDYKAFGGVRKRVKGFKDKTATAQLAAKLEKEAELADAGIIDRYKEHRKRPLAEHLADFQQSLLSKGVTEKHAKECRDRIKRVFDGCEFIKWDDISASTMLTKISGLRKTIEVVETEEKDGKKIKRKKIKDLGAISANTKNYYIGAVKHFCRWMVQSQRAGESPVEHLSKVNTTKGQIVRRALEADEIRRLLEATESSPVRFNTTGHQRAMLYRLAIETGLRANELRSLTASAFDFANCTVTVQAENSKNRQESILPLRLCKSSCLASCQLCKPSLCQANTIWLTC